jgi:hypothetical protein
VLLFLPYVGLPIVWLLRLWMVLAAIVGTSAAYDIAPELAAVAVAGGFLGRWLLLHVFDRAVKAGGRSVVLPSVHWPRDADTVVGSVAPPWNRGPPHVSGRKLRTTSVHQAMATQWDDQC